MFCHALSSSIVAIAGWFFKGDTQWYAMASSLYQLPYDKDEHRAVNDKTNALCSRVISSSSSYDWTKIQVFIIDIIYRFRQRHFRLITFDLNQFLILRPRWIERPKRELVAQADLSSAPIPATSLMTNERGRRGGKSNAKLEKVVSKGKSSGKLSVVNHSLSPTLCL